jgi:hypothetical protein
MGNGQQQRDAGAVRAKPYTSPQLIEYGRVTDLIAGGSGDDTEKAAEPIKKPM